MVASARHFDGSTDVWMRHYLSTLLDDPAFRFPGNTLSIWLDQQVDPSAERTRDNLARVTIQHVVDKSPRSVVLGPAGSGKTLMVRQLVRQLAEEALAQPQALLPLYIPLTFFAGSIEGTLGAQARMRGPAVATLALQRPCILIVDALNDVTPTEQLEVLGMLRRAMHQLGPQGRWLINCRTEQWSLFAPWLQASRSSIWRIRPWNDQTVSTALGRLPGRSVQRLAGYRGCTELARRPRWLGSLLALATERVEDTTLKPGQAGLEWVERVFVEAAQTHCLSEASARVGLTLLNVLAEAISHQSQQTLSRAAVMSIVHEVADGVGVVGEELLALLDATGVLDLVGDDEWALRSVFLTDLARALEVQHDQAEQWQTLIGQGSALPLLYSLLDEPRTLIRTLINAEAWDETRRVLDANEDPAETLAVLESTQCVDIDSGAALGRVWARSGNAEVAVMLLRWAISQGRDDPQLLGLLGDIYLTRGAWAEARDVYKDALQRDPTNLHYQQALARACHELGEDDVATTTLEQAMSTHHRQLAETAFHLGGVYEQRNRYHEAINQYMTAASLVPGDTRFGLAQARVLRLLNRFDEARSLLRSLQATATDPAPLAHEWAALMITQDNDAQALVHLEHLVELGAATAEVYLNIGQIRRRHNETVAAHRAFSTAIDLDPRCRPAYEQLAALALDIGDLQTAASAYRRLAELMPDDGEVFLQLGSLLRRLDQHSDAAQALVTSLTLAPSAEAYLQLARVRWAQGEQARALGNYRSALELNAADGQIAAEAGWALIESGDPVAALEPLHAATVLQPTNARILYDLGRAYEMQARRAEALEWYERATVVAPNWSDAARATGRVAYQVGHTELARKHLALAIRGDRKDGDAWAEVGRLHLQARNGVRAQRALRRAMAYGGTHLSLRRDLAEALLITGHAAEAIRWLEHADEDDAEVQALRSRAYEQLGEPLTALVIARSAAARRPRDHRYQRRLGALALAAGHVSEALVALETAITLGDSDASTQLDLSRALLRAGRAEAALRPAELAVERTPQNAAAYEQIGQVLLALGRYDSAGDAFERAIEYDSASAIAWGGLADVWQIRHSVGTALPYARHALELAPDDDRHRLRLAQLLAVANDYAEAEAMLGTLRQPHFEAEQLLLEIATATEQWGTAIAAAERALSVAPHDAKLLAAYGRALMMASRTADSLQPLSKACASPEAPAEWWAWLGQTHLALGQWGAAAQALEQSIQINNQQPALYAQLAQAYMELQQPITAAQSLQAALESDDRADWRARLAESYEALGWRHEALLEWQRARQLAPDLALYSRQIGRLHLQLGDAHAALSELETTASLDPNDRIAWELCARAALDAGEPARAVHAAASALGLAQDAVTPRQLLGEALLRRGDADRALHCLTPLLELPRLELPALLLIHEAAQAANQPAVARRALEAAYRAAPNDVEVQLRLAAHFKPQEPARALKLLRALAQRESGRADVAATLAEYALDTNDLSLARHAAERAVALAPESNNYQRLLGQICFKLGDHGAARTSLQRVLVNRPQDPATALTLGKLALQRNETTEALRLLQLASQYAPHDPEVQGTLGLALRHSWQPVWEDEPVEPQSDPALQQALVVLDAAAGAAPRWRAEFGWTRLIAGDVAGAVSSLAEAVRQLPPGSEDRALTLRRLALALMHAGQLEEAATVSDHAATLAPSDPIIASIQGQIAEQRDDPHRAVQFYARAAALDPTAGRHHLRLGAALLESNELEVALDHLEQATELEPARAQGWVLLSNVLLRTRQPERALNAAQRATQLAYTDGAAWRQLAAVAVALGRVDTALDAFERATALRPEKDWFVAYADFALEHARDERGHAALHRAAEIDPEDAEIAYRLARLSSGSERIGLLERVVHLNPANAAWRSELAQLLATKGQHRSAIAHLTQAVDTEPHMPQHWIALSEALLQAGDDFAAEANLRRSLTFQPQSAAIWLAQGNLLAARQQWSAALESYARAAEYESTAEAFAGQGHALLHLERYDQAHAALQQAVRIDEQMAGAWADLGRIAFVQGRWKEAVRDSRHALQIDSSLIDGYRTVAQAALELKGDWISEAHEALEHALAIEPDAPDLHALQGWAYYYEGAYEEALQSARAALRGAPDEHTYYLLEGHALRRLRRFKEAVESLRKAVKLNRNYREAIQELLTLTAEIFQQTGERV